MTDHQLNLFDQPLPQRVERLNYTQAMRLFVRFHYGKLRSSSRHDALVRYMEEFFYVKPIETIGRQDTINLLKWLKEEKKQGAWGIIAARGIQRLLFNKLELWKEDGYLGEYDLRALQLPRKNPTFQVPVPKPTRPQVFLNPMEFRGWIKAARRADDFWFEAAFKFGLWFRLSPIDLENLNDDEIFDNDMEIRVHRRHTKTDRQPDGCLQVIELTEKAWALIERCRRYRKPGTKLILPMINKRRRFAKIRKIAKSMGLKDMTLSALRRSASDHLLEKGFPKEAVADGMGHTTTKMLDPHYSRKKHAPHRRILTRELVSSFNG